jgi:hypothetical protein
VTSLVNKPDPAPEPYFASFEEILGILATLAILFCVLYTYKIIQYIILFY